MPTAAMVMMGHHGGPLDAVKDACGAGTDPAEEGRRRRAISVGSRRMPRECPVHAEPIPLAGPGRPRGVPMRKQTSRLSYHPAPGRDRRGARAAGDVGKQFGHTIARCIHTAEKRP